MSQTWGRYKHCLLLTLFCSVFREVTLLPGKEGSVGIGATEGRLLVSYTTHHPSIPAAEKPQRWMGPGESGRERAGARLGCWGHPCLFTAESSSHSLKGLRWGGDLRKINGSLGALSLKIRRRDSHPTSSCPYLVLIIWACHCGGVLYFMRLWLGHQKPLALGSEVSCQIHSHRVPGVGGGAALFEPGHQCYILPASLCSISSVLKGWRRE